MQFGGYEGDEEEDAISVIKEGETDCFHRIESISPFYLNFARREKDAASAVEFVCRSGCSRSAVSAVRKRRVALAEILTADEHFLRSLQLDESDVKLLLARVGLERNEKWEMSSLVPVHEGAGQLNLLTMCALLSNAALHVNCIRSSLISSTAEIRAHADREGELRQLGYEDEQNMKELRRLLADLDESAVQLRGSASELRRVLGFSTPVSLSISTGGISKTSILVALVSVVAGVVLLSRMLPSSR